MRYLLAAVLLSSGCVSGAVLRYSPVDGSAALGVEAVSAGNEGPIVFAGSAFARTSTDRIPFIVTEDLGGGVFAHVHLADATVALQETGVGVGFRYGVPLGPRVTLGVGAHFGLATMAVEGFDSGEVAALAGAGIANASVRMDGPALIRAVRADARFALGPRVHAGVYVEQRDAQAYGTLSFYATDPLYDEWVSLAAHVQPTSVRYGAELVVRF